MPLPSLTHHHRPTPNYRSKLIRRQQQLLVKNIMTMVLLCCVMYGLLQCANPHQSMQTIVVASHAIAKGDSLDHHVQLNTLPTVRETPRGFFTSTHELQGMIASISIAAGEPIIASMVRTSPIIPQGYVTLSIPLANSTDPAIIGQQVDLMCVVDCQVSGIIANNVILIHEATTAQSTSEQLLTSLAVPANQVGALLSATQDGVIVATPAGSAASESGIDVRDSVTSDNEGTLNNNAPSYDD